MKPVCFVSIYYLVSCHTLITKIGFKYTNIGVCRFQTKRCLSASVISIAHLWVFVWGRAHSPISCHNVPGLHPSLAAGGVGAGIPERDRETSGQSATGMSYSQQANRGEGENQQKS